VDDEPQLRDIASKMLSALGYSTDVVASGEKALEFLEKKSVDLVVLDMMMEPGLNGRQVYEKILEIRPGQKTVIASGYSESEDVDACLKLGVGGFVKKPYSFAQLSKVVRNGLLKSEKDG
jgi:CheY-like chemotaxis protein